MDNVLYHFKEFNNQISNIYDEQELIPISQKRFDDKSSSTFLSSIINQKITVKDLPFSWNQIHDDFDFITKDIRYIVGMLYFLQPHIIDTQITNGVYKQNLPDKRYLMYASFGLQSVYNFWDRIGDLLYCFFETGIKYDSVYVGKVLNNIEEIHKEKSEYITLFSVYNDHVKSVLNKRHVAVHDSQLETQHVSGHFEAITNGNTELLNEKKHKLPMIMKEQLNFCLIGFEQCLRLIDTWPDKHYE